MGSAMRRWPTVLLVAIVLGNLTACLKWPNADVNSQPPDKVLFDRATSAMENRRFDVAHMIFQTLVNTYPDSYYAGEAEQSLLDMCAGERNGLWSPQSFTSSAQCGE
jgi:outer membrane protein assembly factor BamD (BamD/ComL family)